MGIWFKIKFIYCTRLELFVLSLETSPLVVLIAALGNSEKHSQNPNDDAESW